MVRSWRAPGPVADDPRHPIGELVVRRCDGTRWRRRPHDLTPGTARAVSAALRVHLAPLARRHEIVGVSCLARGADTLFAEAVLDLGGRIVAVLPSRDYREADVRPDHAPRFDALLAAAAEVHTMDFDHSREPAYEAANAKLLGICDRLVAVWDGRPAGASRQRDTPARHPAAG